MGGGLSPRHLLTRGQHRSPRGGAGDALLRLLPVIMKGSDDESARENLGLSSEM